MSRCLELGKVFNISVALNTQHAFSVHSISCALKMLSTSACQIDIFNCCYKLEVWIKAIKYGEFRGFAFIKLTRLQLLRAICFCSTFYLVASSLDHIPHYI